MCTWYKTLTNIDSIMSNLINEINHGQHRKHFTPTLKSDAPTRFQFKLGKYYAFYHNKDLLREYVLNKKRMELWPVHANNWILIQQNVMIFEAVSNMIDITQRFKVPTSDKLIFLIIKFIRFTCYPTKKPIKFPLRKYNLVRYNKTKFKYTKKFIAEVKTKRALIKKRKTLLKKFQKQQDQSNINEENVNDANANAEIVTEQEEEEEDEEEEEEDVIEADDDEYANIDIESTYVDVSSIYFDPKKLNSVNFRIISTFINELKVKWWTKFIMNSSVDDWIALFMNPAMAKITISMFKSLKIRHFNFAKSRNTKKKNKI